MRSASKRVIKELRKKYPEASGISVYTRERIGQYGEESTTYEIWVFTDEENIPHTYGNTLKDAMKKFREKYYVEQIDTTASRSTETRFTDATFNGDSSIGRAE